MKRQHFYSHCKSDFNFVHFATVVILSCFALVWMTYPLGIFLISKLLNSRRVNTLKIQVEQLERVEK